MATQTYSVATSHPVTGSQWDGDHTFDVSQDAGTGQYYAKADSFGCGHYAETPRQAIRSLVNANGATLVSVAEHQSTGNRLKAGLEFMVVMLQSGRTEEAAKAYDDLIAAFDKLA